MTGRGSEAGAILRLARRRRGLTQTEMAQSAGIPASVLNAYENDKRQPGADAFIKILHSAGFRIELIELPKAPDAVVCARRLSQVLDLAEALPRKAPGPLMYPRLEDLDRVA